MTPSRVNSRAAERWFLDRGLPSVLTTRGRLRAVWPRSAPALAAFAVVAICKLMIFVLTGDNKIDIDAIDVTTEQRLVLVVLALALPVAATIGWLTSRIGSDSRQSIVSAVSVVIAISCDVIQRDYPSLVETCMIIVAIIAITASGIGSVLGWATRLTWSQFKAVGELTVGALPVVLLIVLVFFNTYVWLMAASITPRRLWLMLAILVVIAITFVVSRTIERAKPTLEAASAKAKHAGRLVGTPFENMVDPPEVDPLTRGERFNEVFILAATQIAQILMVAVVQSGIFFLMGLVVLSPEVLDKWTHGGSTSASVVGLTIPVPQALVNMTLFLAALTFMYISARVVSDTEYRSKFLEPLIADLKLTMLARNRYRYNSPTLSHRLNRDRSVPSGSL
jgi:hypothetical protein